MVFINAIVNLEDKIMKLIMQMYKSSQRVNQEYKKLESLLIL
jgi:hypothetical protein